MSADALDASFHNRDALDSVKGILIIAVVLGHSLIAESLIPGLKTVVYSFHVQCFLLFPFLFPAATLTHQNVGHTLVRYLVPYAYSVVAFGVFHGMASRDVGLGTWILDVLKALVTGNANDLKQVTGFYLFWFLPVLSVTVILKMVYFNQRERLRLALATCAIAAHLLLPAMPWSLKQKWPLFGTHIALFVFPLGLCIHYWAVPILAMFRGKWRLLLPAFFALSLGLLMWWGMGANLGNLGYASCRNPTALILQDSVAISAFLCLLVFAQELACVPFLSQIGSKSLVIYLFSQAFVAGTVRLFDNWTSDTDSAVFSYGLAGLSVLCGILGPFLVARFVFSRERLRSTLFPRSLDDLLSGLGMKGRVHASGVAGV